MKGVKVLEITNIFQATNKSSKVINWKLYKLSIKRVKQNKFNNGAKRK